MASSHSTISMAVHLATFRRARVIASRSSNGQPATVSNQLASVVYQLASDAAGDAMGVGIAQAVKRRVARCERLELH